MHTGFYHPCVHETDIFKGKQNTAKAMNVYLLSIQHNSYAIYYTLLLG